MADNGNKFITFLKNNWIKYLVQTVIALILSLIVMNFRGQIQGCVRWIFGDGDALYQFRYSYVGIDDGLF